MRKNALKRMFGIVITLSLISGVFVSAAASDVSIRASDYLSYYSATTYAIPGGGVDVWFDVTATRIMDYVGASHIIIQVYNNGSWTGIQTYFGTAANGMLATKAISHVGHITYQGAPGQMYRAMVNIHATNSSGSDYKTIYTNVVTA